MRMSEEEWAEVKAALTVGVLVTGWVSAHRAFGFFVKLDAFETVPALIEIPEYSRQLGRSVDLEDFPPIGERVRAVVLDHIDGVQRIRLSRVQQIGA